MNLQFMRHKWVIRTLMAYAGLVAIGLMVRVASAQSGNSTTTVIESDVLVPFVWIGWAAFAALVYVVPAGVPRTVVSLVGFGILIVPIEGLQKTILLSVQIAFFLWIVYDGYERELFMKNN